MAGQPVITWIARSFAANDRVISSLQMVFTNLREEHPACNAGQKKQYSILKSIGSI